MRKVLGVLFAGAPLGSLGAVVALFACGGVTASSTSTGGAKATSSTSSTPTSSSTSGRTCPAATLGCEPSATRYLGGCGSYCAPPFAPAQGSLTQTCDATGQWGPSQCIAPTDCGSSSTTSSSGSSTSSSASGGCPSPCDGGCPDEAIDPQNCGACGKACAANELCTMGACSCPTPCGSACLDLQTDPQNCGACGTACRSGQSCVTGGCVLAATSALRAGALAIHGSTLYLSSFSTGPSGAENHGRIYAAPTTGTGAATLLYDDPDMDVRALAADASFVYALDVLKNRVLAIPEAGGGLPLVLASGFSSAAYGLAIGGGYAFWPAQSGLLEAPLACGATTVLQASTPTNAPGSVTTNASDVYWIAATDDVFGAVAAGGPATTLATYTFCFGKLAADAARVYCLTENGIDEVPVGGGSMQNVVTGISPAYGSDLAVDGTSLYWADMAGVKKAPIAGGSATAYPATVAPTGPLVIDDRSVYWAAYQGVVQTPK